jgi:nitrite reductase/ring-hydroxylating ferredoxin subunit
MNSGKKYKWYKIAESEEELQFSEHQVAVVEIKEKKICIGRYGPELFAFANKCPHAGGCLAEGDIDVTGNIICPLHRYKFSMENGQNTSGEGYHLKHWTVERRSDGIYVAMEESSLFGWIR